MGWLPGEYLADARSLRLPFDLADGEYRLGVGFYDPVTGVRLGDRVILDTPDPRQRRGGLPVSLMSETRPRTPDVERRIAPGKQERSQFSTSVSPTKG